MRALLDPCPSRDSFRPSHHTDPPANGQGKQSALTKDSWSSSVATVWQQSPRKMRIRSSANPDDSDDLDAGGRIYTLASRFRSVWRKLREGSSPFIRIRD